MEHRMVYPNRSGRPQVTVEEMLQAFRSKRAEQRARVLRLEIDYELAVLHEALQLGRTEEADACKQRLRKMRLEMMQLEL
jgi:hypothetical protein